MRLKAGITLIALSTAVSAYADESYTTDAVDRQVIIPEPVQPQDAVDIAVPAALPSETKRSADEPEMTKEEYLAYLSNNQQELEMLIAQVIKAANAEALRELLPIYERFETKDESLIQWGNALIERAQGNYQSAISTLRRLNAQFPEVRILRFQLASALLENRQFQAARSELEKIASEEMAEEDRQLINRMIEIAKSNEDWSFNTNVSYVNDENINNTPPVGTKIGKNWTYSTPRESGKGVNYGLGADKRWVSDSGWFTGVDLSTYGTYYWDNKKFNTISARSSFETGYQNETTEIFLKPFYLANWYGGGTNAKSDGLSHYRDSYGVQLNAMHSLDKQTQYYANLGYTENKYQESSRSSDNSKDYNVSQTLAYSMNPKTYFFGGFDHLRRNSNSAPDSFYRYGTRLGWGQVWPKGFSTRASVSYALRRYDEAMYIIPIKRKSEEIGVNFSLWNRGFSILGLTPRLNLSYSKLNSNYAFEEYDKKDVSIEFTKTF